VRRLLIFFIVVLDACHNVGLGVIATMFDMGANSVKALFLKQYISSGFRVKKMQLYLVLLISLNVPATLS